MCANCGHTVKGTGYTNHCPKCLWSKHVDKNPGDRAESCGGMMAPVGIETKKGEYVLVHRCQTCGHKKRNNASPGDDFDELIRIAALRGLSI